MDHIDYTPENFVHADLTPKEISEVLRQRGENEVTLILGVLTDIMKQHNAAMSGGKNGTQKGVPAVDPAELMARIKELEKGLRRLERLCARQQKQLDKPFRVVLKR